MIHPQTSSVNVFKYSTSQKNKPDVKSFYTDLELDLARYLDLVRLIKTRRLLEAASPGSKDLQSIFLIL